MVLGRLIGHFRRGSDESLPAFDEADARLRGAARLAVLDAARRQRRRARAFRSWNAATVAAAVADAQEAVHAHALRDRDAGHARRVEEALAAAYAGHAAELAAQAVELGERRKLALAGQRASLHRTPPKPGATDALQALRRSHDATLVALKACHAKELTQATTAISLQKDRERAAALNDALRAAETAHAGHMAQRAAIVAERTPCKTPGLERAARAAADDVSPETRANAAKPGAARAADVRALCLVLSSKVRHKRSSALARRFATWSRNSRTASLKARAALLLKTMTERVIVRVAQQRVWRVWRDILIAKRVFVEAEVRQREIGEENEARLRLLRVDYDQLTAERQHDLDNDLENAESPRRDGALKERFCKELETQRAKLVRQHSQHAQELQMTQSKLSLEHRSQVVRAVAAREAELGAAHALVLHDLNKGYREKLSALVDKQQGDVDYLRVSCTTELESAVDSLKFEHERELSARRKATLLAVQTSDTHRDAALRAIGAARTSSTKARAARVVYQVLKRWAARSAAGAFAFWRDVARTAVIIEDAHTRAARLFGQVFQRWARKSQSCAFLCWRAAAAARVRIDDAHRRATRLLAQALHRVLRRSEGGAFAWWVAITRDARRVGERRTLAIRLFSEALQRGAQRSAHGSFAWWRTTAQQMRARTLALRLFDRAFRHWARQSSTAAFLWWRRSTTLARDAEAQSRRSLEAAHAAATAKTRAAVALERVARRWARTCVDGAFEWWHRRAAAERASDAAKTRATVQLRRSLARWARRSSAGAFLWWRRVVVGQQALERHERAQERALGALERVAARYMRTSLAGAVEWWRRGLAIDDARRRGVALFDLVLRRWARRSTAAAFLRLQRKAHLRRQLLKAEMRHAAARDTADTLRDAALAEALRALEGRLADAFTKERSALEADAARRLADERAALTSQHGAELMKLAADRARGEALLAHQSDADANLLRAEYAKQTDRDKAAHAASLAEAKLLYGDDLAELHGQLDDAQLREGPQTDEHQHALRALEAEASAQVRGMSLSMAVVFFSNALEARSRRLVARAFAMLRTAAAAAAVVALCEADHASALRAVVQASSQAAARVAGSSDLARALGTFVRRRRVRAWNRWRRCALYQRFVDEREAHAADLASLKEQCAADTDAARSERDDAVARARSDGEASLAEREADAQGLLAALERELLAYHGADLDALDAKHQRDVADAVAAAEQRLQAQRAQVRGMSTSMAAVFFSNALESRSRRLSARAFAVLKAAAAAAAAVALREAAHASEQNLLVAAHAAELAAIKEQCAAALEANADASQLELEDAVARALSDRDHATREALADREAGAIEKLEARERELVACHGADMDARNATHAQDVEAAVAAAEARLNAQREAAERALVETHWSALESAQAASVAAAVAAVAETDRLRFLDAQKQALRREKRRTRALRAVDRSLRRWCRSSLAAALVFWRRVAAEARARDEARVHAANLFGQALLRFAHKRAGGCFMLWRSVLREDDTQKHAARLLEQAIWRLARGSVGGAFTWWLRVVADARVETKMRGHAVRLLESSLIRMAHTSVAGALLWWRRVAANATTSLRAKRRALRGLERVMRRWARTSMAGSVAWWARSARDLRTGDDAKRVAARLFARALERLATKSRTAAYLVWKRTTDAHNADTSRSGGALLVTRGLSRETRFLLRAFLPWKAAARYLLIDDERERDHDQALRRAVSSARTALLKASAGSALGRITQRSRFVQAWRAWRALSLQAAATRHLVRVCQRWVRTSVYGSFAWWRRVVRDAAAIDEAHQQAARLFDQALQRWSCKSRSGAFVWWRLVATEARAADERHGRSLHYLNQALARFARKLIAGALLYWRRVAADMSTRFHATVLLEQALCRLARTSQGAAFVWWARIVRNMRRDDEAKARAARLLCQAVHRLARASEAGSFVWWRRVAFEARASDEARVHAANLFGQALTRLAHKHTGSCFMLWRSVLLIEDQRRHASILFEQALGRLARKSVNGSFTWWHGVARQAVEAEASKRRSAAAMERVVLRFVRMSMHGSFVWWRHVVSSSLATDERRLLALTLLDRALRGWARKSAVAALVYWRRQTLNLKQIEDSWQLGTRRMWRSFRRLAENRERRFFLRWRSTVPRQASLGDPRRRLLHLLRRAVVRREHTAAADAFGRWRRRTASYSSRELSLHFLERVVRRHAKASVRSGFLAWRLRAKHTAVTAVAGAAKRRYEELLLVDARCAALVAEAARRAEMARLRLVLMRGSLVDAGLWMLAGRHKKTRMRALRRGFDACGRAIHASRVLDRCVRKLAHFHSGLALDRWRVAAGSRTRAIAALRAYVAHLNVRGRADALRRTVSQWRRAVDGDALRLRLEAMNAASARAAADGLAEIRAARDEVNDAVRAATRRVRETRDDRETAMLDAQRRDLSRRHEAELEFVESERDARTQRLVLGGMCSRWARRTRAGVFVFWQGKRRAIEATRLRSVTLLPRLVHSLSTCFERRQLMATLRQLQRHALDVRRRQINASEGVNKLRRRLTIWLRRRRHAALLTWRANAVNSRWRLALACGRVTQCMRRRSRWRRRAALRIWRERVKDAPRACQLIGRLLSRSAISRLMGAFRQWHDHFCFMYELHKALGRSVLKQKQELLETQRKLRRRYATPTKEPARMTARNRALESILKEREARTDRMVASLQDEGEPPPFTPRSRSGSFRSPFDVARYRSP